MVDIKENNISNYRVSIAVYGVMLLTIVYIGRIQELLPGFNNLSIGKVVFVLSILLLIVSPRNRLNSLSGIIQIKYIVGIFICAVISIPLSYWPGGSLDFLAQVHIKTLIFFFLIITVVKNISEIHKVVWAITCSVFALSLTVLISGGEGRLSASSSYDPNDLAFVLVTFMPIVYYFMKHKSGVPKLVLQTTLVIMLIAMLATESRGGIIGLVAISAIIFKKQGKNFKQAIFPLIVIVVIVITFASGRFWERMSTMLNPEEDYNISAGGGRMEIWKSGLKMMIRRPVTGVGINAFEIAEGESHLDVETGNSGKWSSPHNSFIQIGAELGLIGLFFFIKLLSSSIKAIRECRANKLLGSSSQWLLDGTEVAFYGYIVTGFFLSQAYGSVLYLLIALAVLAQKLGKQTSSDIVMQQ